MAWGKKQKKLLPYTGVDFVLFNLHGEVTQIRTLTLKTESQHYDDFSDHDVFMHMDMMTLTKCVDVPFEKFD